jgi:hypothetical protein
MRSPERTLLHWSIGQQHFLKPAHRQVGTEAEWHNQPGSRFAALLSVPSTFPAAGFDFLLLNDPCHIDNRYNYCYHNTLERLPRYRRCGYFSNM